jgi:PKD repeat protein
MRANHLLVVVALAGLVAGACDKATPTAPAGSTLTITASPLEIAASGTASVTVIATRASGGGPVTPGTEIRLSTTLGTIDEVVTTDTSGVARATLRGNGRSGTAKITASSGAAAPVTIDVKVGATVERINLAVSPTSVSVDSNAVINLTATVRDNQGLALPGAGVLFGAEVGQLDNNGIVTTNANGQATNRLRVSSAELSLLADSSLEVRADVSGGGGNAATTAQVLVQRPPIAAFTFTINQSTRTVTFTDQSTGSPTQWAWDVDGDGDIDATSPNFTYQYPAAGTYRVTLTVRNAFGEGEAVQQIVITQ